MRRGKELIGKGLGRTFDHKVPTASPAPSIAGTIMPPKRPRKSCQAPQSVQKPSMSHHPDKIKNPAKMHLSYAPFGTLNVVELKRKGPASKPGLSLLRSQIINARATPRR
jgi:hypothetical protein